MHGGAQVLAWWVGCPCLPLAGLPVLLTNMELGLECPELQWLLQREQLCPPQLQPGFCLYLSTTLPLSSLEKGEAQWVSCQNSFVGTPGPELHSVSLAQSGLRTVAGSHAPCASHPWLCQGEEVKCLPCDSKC